MIGLLCSYASALRGYNGKRFYKASNLVEIMYQELYIDEGLKEADCVKACRSVITKYPDKWQHLSGYPLLMCHHGIANQQKGKCVMTAHEEKVTINGTNQVKMFYHLNENSDWTTYVNLIPDGLDSKINYAGWYWGAKCANQNSSLTNEEQLSATVTTLNKSFQHYNQTYSPSFGQRCVEYHYSNTGVITAKTYDNCDSIQEDSSTQDSFCMIFNNDNIEDTPVGDIQQHDMGDEGVEFQSHKCHPDFFNHLTIYTFLGVKPQQDGCLSACRNYRVNAEFKDAYVYCCMYTKNTYMNNDLGHCNIYGSNEKNISISNAFTGSGSHNSYFPMKPRNLREWDKAYGLNASTSCKTEVNNTVFTQGSLTTLDQCFTNFKIWARESPESAIAGNKICAEFNGETGACGFNTKCQQGQDNQSNHTSKKFCLKINSRECVIRLQNHETSGQTSANVDIGRCFAISPVTFTGLCSQEVLEYQLTDPAGNNLTSHFLRVDDLNRIHVCPYKITTAQSLDFKIKVTLGHRPGNPITDEKIYNMTVTSTIAKGFHGNEGRKLTNAYCEIRDVPGGAFQGILEHDTQMNTSNTDEEQAAECLEYCLSRQMSGVQQSIFCCEYRNNDNYCHLRGNSSPYIGSRDRGYNNVTSHLMITYQGLIPRDFDYFNPNNGGWRWDAYCQGTYASQVYTDNMYQCRQHWLTQENNASSCAEYRQSENLCILYKDCDPFVGILPGVFCFNPSYNGTDSIKAVMEQKTLNQLTSPTDLPDQNFTVGQEPAIYEFQHFDCAFCSKAIKYEIVNLSPEPTNDTQSDTPLVLNEIQTASSTIQITVNTSKEAALNFSIMAYFEGENKTINATSNPISIFIINNVTTVPLINQTLINRPPQFVEVLPSEIPIQQLYPETKEYFYNLPQREDDLDTPAGIQLDVTGFNESFTEYDSENETLHFFNLSDSRNTTVTIKLTDTQGLSQTFEVKFMFDIQQVIEASPSQQEIEEVKSTFAGVSIEERDKEMRERKESGDEEEVPEFTCKIKSISEQAEVLVLFSEDAEIFDKSFINETSLLLTVVPSETKTQEQLDNMDFTWKVLQFYSNRLYLQINFVNPLYISTSLEQDSLEIVFNDTSLFRADKTKMPLETNYKIKKNIKPQNVNTKAAQTFTAATEEAAGYMTRSFWLIYIATTVASSNNIGLVYIQLINSLQMIVYAPIANIRFPANTMSLITSTQPIAQFDPLDSLENSNHSIEEMNIWDKDDTQFEQQNFSGQMIDLGFESLNSILNLGSLAFFLNLYVVKNIIFSVLYLTVVKRYGWFSEVVPQQLRNARYNEIILLTIESCQDMFVSGYLQSLKVTVSWMYFGDAMSSVLGYICLILICLILILYVYILLQDKEVIDSEEFKSKYGAFYDSVKTSDKFKLSYNMVFVLRRVIFCIALFALESGGCQFVLIYFNNLIYSIYFFHYMPKSEPYLQYLEMFNEVLINIIILHMVPFTNFGPNPEAQNAWGFSMCGFICLLQLVNVLGCVYFLGYDMRLVCIRHYRRWPLYQQQLIASILGCIGKYSGKIPADSKEPTKKKEGTSQSSSSESSSEESIEKPLNAPRSGQDKDKQGEVDKKILSHMDAIADAQLEIKKIKQEMADKEEIKDEGERMADKDIEEVKRDIEEKTVQVALTEVRIDKRLKDRNAKGQDYSKPFEQRIPLPLLLEQNEVECEKIILEEFKKTEKMKKQIQEAQEIVEQRQNEPPTKKATQSQEFFKEPKPHALVQLKQKRDKFQAFRKQMGQKYAKAQQTKMAALIDQQANKQIQKVNSQKQIQEQQKAQKLRRIEESKNEDKKPTDKSSQRSITEVLDDIEKDRNKRDEIVDDLG